MEILRKGKSMELRVEFTCHNCGCVSVAEPGEYSITSSGNAENITAYEAVCPNCDAVIYSHKAFEVDCDMMTDKKAIRAAELIRQYCAERGCSQCVFESKAKFCLLQGSRIPGKFPVEEIRKDRLNE